MKRTRTEIAEAGWSSVVWKMKLRFEAMYGGKRNVHIKWEEFFPPKDRSGERRADEADAVRCTRATYERCLAVLNPICLAAESAGFEVEMGYRCTRLELSRDGAPVWIRVVEKSAPGNPNDRTNPDQPYRWHGRIGTGQLELILTQYGGGTSVFRDKDDRKLEQLIPEIIGTIERRHAGAVAYKAKSDAHQEQWQNERLEQERQQKQLALEKQKREDLVRRAVGWNHAQQIRAFVAGLRQKVDGGMPPPADFEAWTEWALKVSDEMDDESSRLPRD